MRRFELIDSKSRKFWEIHVDDNKVQLRWGRIGTAGQSKVKETADSGAAIKEADKLISSKVKKGYSEVLQDPLVQVIESKDSSKQGNGPARHPLLVRLENVLTSQFGSGEKISFHLKRVCSESEITNLKKVLGEDLPPLCEEFLRWAPEQGDSAELAFFWPARLELLNLSHLHNFDGLPSGCQALFGNETEEDCLLLDMAGILDGQPGQLIEYNARQETIRIAHHSMEEFLTRLCESLEEGLWVLGRERVWIRSYHEWQTFCLDRGGPYLEASCAIAWKQEFRLKELSEKSDLLEKIRPFAEVNFKDIERDVSAIMAAPLPAEEDELLRFAWEYCVFLKARDLYENSQDYLGTLRLVSQMRWAKLKDWVTNTLWLVLKSTLKSENLSDHCRQALLAGGLSEDDLPGLLDAHRVTPSFQKPCRGVFIQLSEEFANVLEYDLESTELILWTCQFPAEAWGILNFASAYLGKGHSKEDEAGWFGKAGSLLFEVGRTQHAMSLWEISLSIHPDAPVAKQSLDELKWTGHKSNSALTEHLKDLLSLKPDHEHWISYEVADAWWYEDMAKRLGLSVYSPVSEEKRQPKTEFGSKSVTRAWADYLAQKKRLGLNSDYPPPLSTRELEELAKELAVEFHPELREYFTNCSRATPEWVMGANWDEGCILSELDYQNGFYPPFDKDWIPIGNGQGNEVSIYHNRLGQYWFMRFESEWVAYTTPFSLAALLEKATEWMTSHEEVLEVEDFRDEIETSCGECPEILHRRW